MSDILYDLQHTKYELLDHGYLKLIDRWGADAQIIEAARMSTNKGFLGWEPESTWTCNLCGYTMDVPHNDKSNIQVHHCRRTDQREPMLYVKGHNGDVKLLTYLYQHKHMTPFEMAGMTIEVQAPIFVFREWHRHRTQSYNEMSARYTPLPDVNYVPTKERLLMLGKDNKQAVGLDGKVLDEYNAVVWLQELQDLYAQAERIYQLGLELGVPKELARLPVPVARYSKMRASANLRNWLAFLTLRMDPAAQWEIRQYANTVGLLITQLFPRTWQLFDHGRTHA